MQDDIVLIFVGYLVNEMITYARASQKEDVFSPE